MCTHKRNVIRVVAESYVKGKVQRLLDKLDMNLQLLDPHVIKSIFSRYGSQFYPLFCPPPFRRKARGHRSIQLSVVCGAWFVVRGSEFIVGTLWAQLLLQFLTNPSEILQVSSSWSENVYVLFTESLIYFFFSLFSHF